MTVDPWPCRCGAEGVKNLGVYGYCSTCLTALLTTFDPAAFEMCGVWVLDGVMRPDHGPRFAECRCLACGYTAVAVVGESCPDCERSRERMATWQAEILLWPDLPDIDDERYEAAAEAWGERLKVAVEADILPLAKARAAWNRVVPDAA